MMFTNSALLGSDNLYAVCTSSDKSRVAYVSYGYCDKDNVLCRECNFISNIRNVSNFIPDRDIFYVNINFIFDCKDKIIPMADNIQTILIGGVSYYIIKVYACMHSSISLSLTPYTDKFDSGLGGFVLIKEADCPLEKVISMAEGFIQDLELYLTGNIFNVDIFSVDNQDDLVNCTTDIIEPSKLCEYLNGIDFPCEESDIFLSYDISDKIKKTYTLEV